MQIIHLHNQYLHPLINAQTKLVSKVTSLREFKIQVSHNHQQVQSDTKIPLKS